MAEAYLRQSPLASLHLAARASESAKVLGGDAGVTLGERPHRGQLVLRGDANEAAFMEAAAKALGFSRGVSLPVDPNTVAAKGKTTVLWLGPDEWLVVTPPGSEGKTVKRLATALGNPLAGIHAAVTDVSESRTVIRLAGAKARDVLMKGYRLDLHASVFGPGRCAQSTLAKANVILHQVDKTPAYDIYVHRSFAEYLWAWLEDAGGEYGVTITGP